MLEIILASQISVSVSGSLASSAARLSSTGRFPRRVRTSQQTRSFRFGLWSAHLDRSFQKELQHHHRFSKHKYNELVNQNVSWGRKLPKSARYLGLKGFMCSAWQRKDIGPSGQQNGSYVPRSSGPHKSQQSRIRGIEWDEFERIFHERVTARPFRRTASRLYSSSIFPLDIQGSKPSPKPTVPSESSSNGEDKTSDYVIDPITNRKVFVGSSAIQENSTRKPVHIPVKTLHEYQSQPRGFTPPGPDPINETNKEALSRLDADEDGFKAYDANMSYDKPFTAYEPNGHPPSQNIPDPVQEGLKAYDSKATYNKPFTAYEPHGRPPTQEQIDPVQEGLKAYDEVISYNKPFTAYEPDGKPPAPDPLGAMHESLAAYDSEMSYDKPFAAYEPDGQAPPQHKQAGPVQEAVKSYYNGSGNTISVYQNETGGKTPIHWSSDSHAASRPLKFHKAKIRAEKQASRNELNEEFDKAQQDRSSIIEDAKAMENIKQARQLAAEADIHSNADIPRTGESIRAAPQKMTGNFVRDFPEEFKASWVATKGEPGTLVPKTETTGENVSVPAKGLKQSELDNVERMVQRAEKEANETLFEAINPARIQPSLDRTTSRSDDTNEVETATHPSKQQTEEQKSSEISPQDTVPEEATMHKPTLYKILAYDPTMQSISIAETTSVVPDSARALTPAEVLLRLSNPTKFMPHFEPLQSQGYEIVSGSGDVLVFRHVRAGFLSEASSASPVNGRELKKTARNPIDGMYPVVATGNFASPTGFVNLDFPEPSESEPAFKSNVDVRREEPVFSGKRNWDDDELPKTKTGGRGKRLLIGAVWVAGCSYAIGVVAEFFRTGGIDGIGPQGF